MWLIVPSKEGQNLHLDEALDLLTEIFEEDSLAPHYNGSSEMYSTSARLFVLMKKLGQDIDPEDLAAAQKRLEE